MLALRPTFSESWYRVASLKIRLRPSAQITRQFHRGERWYVIRDPAANQFMRLSDGAYQFVGLLDGKRSVAEAWEIAGGQLDDAAPTQPEVIQILSQLHQANLVEADITPDAQVLLRRHKAMQRQQWKQRAMNFLFPRIPLPFDLNGIVTRWLSVASILFSRLGIVLWLAVVIAAIVALLPDWQALWNQHNSALALNNALWLYAVFVFTKVIHEFGHAFACRKFGGEVHEMGIMLLVFVPTPYVDASTAWAFPSRWQRMFVGAAGMYTELFFAALMAFVWKFTHDPTISLIAYNSMLVASVSTILFNANPLLRYDGYYMLSDFLEIPNLQQKSKDYGWGLIKRHVFRVKQQQPLPTPLQRFWLFNYFWTSGIYRVFVGVMIILVVKDRVPVLGYLMAIGGVVTWSIVPLFSLVRYLSLDPELHRKRTLGWGFTLGSFGVLFLLLGLLRSPVRVWSDAIIMPQQMRILRPGYDGFVKQILIKDEQLVTAGQTLVVMENPTLDANIADTQAKLAAARIRWQLAITNDQTQRNIEEETIVELQKRLKELQTWKSELTIVAPFDGRVIAPHLDELANGYVARGKEFARIVTLDKLEAWALVDQEEAGYIETIRQRAGDRAPSQVDDSTTIWLASDVFKPLHPVGQAHVVQGAQFRLPHPSLGVAGGGKEVTDMRDENNVKTEQKPFVVVMQLDNSNLDYTPGQRAHVRFTVDSQSVLWKSYRRLLQLLEIKDTHSKWAS